MGNKVKGGRMTEDASVIKVSSRVFSRTRLEVGEGGRVTSRSRYTFSITRWIYSWHPVLRLTSPSAASRKSWRGGGRRRKARRGHSRNSSSTTSPPSFHFNNRYEVSGRCEMPRPSSSSAARCSMLVLSSRDASTDNYFDEKGDETFFGYFEKWPGREKERG